MEMADPYRRMLTDVADNITDDDAKNLAPLLSLKPARRAKITNGRTLIEEMEKTKFVSKENVDRLRELLKDKDLPEAAEVVEKYKLEINGEVVDSFRSPVENYPKSHEADSGQIRDVGDRYTMTREPRGHCLLLTYEKFQNTSIKDRGGNAVDRENLRKLFGEMLKFEVHDKDDLTLEQTEAVIKEISESKHGDCFICVVCSHGEATSFKTADGKNMDIERLIDHFKPQSCPGLAGKPKLFFLNFCLGDKHQTYTLVSDGIDEVSKRFAKEADFLITYSTLPGFKSLRDPRKGTIYVQNLYKCFMDFYQSEHLVEILTRVRKAMDDQLKSVGFKTENGEICCQVSESRDRLFKKVYFHQV